MVHDFSQGRGNGIMLISPNFNYTSVCIRLAMLALRNLGQQVRLVVKESHIYLLKRSVIWLKLSGGQFHKRLDTFMKTFRFERLSTTVGYDS